MSLLVRYSFCLQRRDLDRHELGYLLPPIAGPNGKEFRDVIDVTLIEPSTEKVTELVVEPVTAVDRLLPAMRAPATVLGITELLPALSPSEKSALDGLVNIEGYADAVPVPAFRARVVCSAISIPRPAVRVALIWKSDAMLDRNHSNLWPTANLIKEELMNSKKLQMLTALAASILLGIGLAIIPASAKTNKESSAYSAKASSKEKKPSKKTAKNESSKQSAKNATTKAKTVGQGGGGGGKY